MQIFLFATKSFALAIKLFAQNIIIIRIVLID